MSEWISVKDRLPEEGEEVLIYTELDFFLVATFSKNPEAWICSWDFGIVYCSVVCWMPLPEPPEEESE